MSRIGKKVIHIPSNVTVDVHESGLVTVKGPLGTLSHPFSKAMKYEVEGEHLTVVRPDDSIEMKALHGTTRAILANMVEGVSKGYSKKLIINGIGYRAEMKGKDLVLHVGYSHGITIHPLDGVTVKVIESKSKDVNAYVEVSGSDKFKVGQVAAQIRETRKPEPYLGKGIRELMYD